MVREVVRHYAGPGAEFDDLYQEAWKTLTSELPRFQYDSRRGTFRGWIWSVVRHAASDAAKHLSRGRMEALTAEIAGLLIDPAPDPAEVTQRGVDHEQVHAAIADLRPRLSDQTHRMVVMHWVEGRSAAEIAAESGLSVHSVEMRLSRASTTLRPLLHDRGIDGW